MRDDLPIDVPVMNLSCLTCGATVAGAYHLFLQQHDGHDLDVEVPNTAEEET